MKSMSSIHPPADVLKLPEAPVLYMTILLLCTLWFIRTHFQSTKRLPYPPGPKGLWYFGFSKFPTKKPWLTYVEWGKQYGDLIHFSRFGKHYVVINSLEVANEILGQKAQITSSRPSTSGLDQIAQWGRFLGMTPYGDEWRKGRKLFHQIFRAEAVARFHSVEKQEIENFISGLTTSKLPLKDQIETLSQKIMFKALYGLDISSSKDDLPHHAREMVEISELALLPGWDAFKYLPLIDLLPSWFPGGHIKVSYKRFGQELRKLSEEPWSLMMNVIDSRQNDYNSALIPELISRLEPPVGGSDTEVERIKNMGGQAVGAASDTTMSAISTFWLAMSLYPDIQKKAHQELDSVLGPGKLPDFNDRSSLPYIEAIYREVMRWHPAVPMGVPHVNTEAVHCNGYYIPKGSNIHANIWAMTHNPSVYENPDHFIPERHLHKNGQFESINSILAYGFGRRICVGRYMADDTIWLTIALVLATINISTIPNENVEEKYTDTNLCSPKLLDLAVQPRHNCWKSYFDAGSS